MQRHSATEARRGLARLLDAAERGERVIIERRGAQFELCLRRTQSRRSHGARLIVSMDPAVERGQWSWRLGAEGLEFMPHARRG